MFVLTQLPSEYSLGPPIISAVSYLFFRKTSQAEMQLTKIGVEESFEISASYEQ